MFSVGFVLLTAGLLSVSGEKFHCEADQPFCYWIGKSSSNWSTAYADCTRTGGSLISSEHSAYIEEWMSSTISATSSGQLKVWSSLHRINNRFQWLHHKPEFRPIAATEWIPGHPLVQSTTTKNCVVLNQRTQFESVSCDDLFAIICAISRNRKLELKNLALPSLGDVQVKLAIDSTDFSVYDGTNHLEIDRNSNLRLKCNVIYSGSRNLEYSWLKDGVYLENNTTAIIPTMVNDKSKPLYDGEKHALYQKQGTYECQVREFGSVEASTSNAIILTYRGVYNGIVSLRPTEASNSFNNLEIMDKVMIFIKQDILKNELKLTDVEVSWGPLYASMSELDEFEFKNSLYVDILREYPNNILYNILDVISEKVRNILKLRAEVLAVKSIRLEWANYCPRQNQTIIHPSTFESIQIQWPASSSASRVYPNNVNELCIQDSNVPKPLNRQCLPNFTHSASLAPLNTKICDQLVTLPEFRCRHGYRWMHAMQLCYKVTDNGTWHETMADCISEWPANDMEAVNYTVHHSALTNLQVENGLTEFWLPIRRVSIYGQLLYYPTVVNNGPVVTSLMSSESWTELQNEECLLLDKESLTQLSDCSQRRLPAICVHRPKDTEILMASNLCPPFWYGFRIQQSRLVCFSLIRNESPMDWHQAEQKCRQENFDVAAQISMATFENPGKAQQWDIVRSKVYATRESKVNSAWIGLRWSESYRKFCWSSSDNNCTFQYFNWRSPTNWIDGHHYGVMNEEGSWDLLSSTSLRHEVLCQAEIDLTVTQDISLRQLPNDIISVDVSQQIQQPGSATQLIFSDLTEFFSFGWRPMMTFPAASQIGTSIKCYLDGELLKSIEQFPATFSLRPSFSVASTFDCEGWLSWPRRFVRTESSVVLRPHNSLIYILHLNANRSEEKADQEKTIDFRSEPIDDISQRLSVFNSNGDIVKLKDHRRWDYGGQIRILIRAIISTRPGFQQANWPQLMKNVLLQPSNQSNQFNYEVVDIRSGDICEEEASSIILPGGPITWNSVPIGYTSESTTLCQIGGQPLTRKCLGNPNTGAYWEPFTDLSLSNTNCSQETDLFVTLKKLTDECINNVISPISALDELAGLGNQLIDSIGGFEIGQAARLLHASVERLEQPLEQQFLLGCQTLTTILSSPTQLGFAQALPGISNNLVASLEHLMGTVSVPDGQDGVTFRHPKMATETSLTTEKVVGFGAKIDQNSLEIVDSQRIFHNDTEDSLVKDLAHRDIAVILPINEIRSREGLGNSTNLRLSFSVFPNADLFDARPVTSLTTNGVSLPFIVNSAVIVAQVGSSSVSNLNQSVRIFFRARSQHKDSVTPVCVFWDKSASVGFWSPIGCQYAGKSQDMYICECNHLTPLALLFPYFDSDQTVDDGHIQALSFISFIGCIASMIGLSLVLMTFLLFKKWRKSLGNKILFNFSIALFCVTVCFLCAGYVTFDPRLCKATAVAMHYFLIASFAWMVVEGIYQYLNYVIVIGAKNYKSRFMRRAGPLAWGLPILPVLGVLIHDSKLYTMHDEFCWMELEAFYIAVLVPISSIFLFNLLIFIGVLKSVICIRMRGIRTSQSVQTRSWYQLRMAVCIFFLLGLTSLFGFVSVGDARLVFAYLFCIFHSLQGFIIFVFFVLREKNARKLWLEFTRTSQHDKLNSTSKSPYASRSFPT